MVALRRPEGVKVGVLGIPMKILQQKFAGSLLFENGYKCSGILSKTGLWPRDNFVGGFHRYNMLGHVNDPSLPVLERNWTSDRCVNQVIEWLDTDMRHTNHGISFISFM
jgi:hypothetical protein